MSFFTSLTALTLWQMHVTLSIAIPLAKQAPSLCRNRRVQPMPTEFLEIVNDKESGTLRRFQSQFRRMRMSQGTRRGFLQAAGVAVAGLSGTSKVAGRVPETAASVPPWRIFDVREFGAKGDGKSVDSPAINHAIEAAADAGGGTVLFSAGTYLCYSIRLKSKVALSLGMGCT